jgi:predicted HTH domain antitoxin
MIKTEDISKDVPYFKDKEKKEIFLYVVGALSLRLISLKKAAELLNMDTATLLNMLENSGYSYSFLEKGDEQIEKEW